MLLAHAATVEFTAALVRPGRLGPGGTQAVVTLGGLVPRTRAGSGAAVEEAFYQPALALGSLASRLGTAERGDVITGRALINYDSRGVGVVIDEAARVAPCPERLTFDDHGGVLLRRASLRAHVRGLLMGPPALRRLTDETLVCNVTLGLTPRRRDQTRREALIPIEIAQYGPAASALAALAPGRYLTVTGPLQRRLMGEGRRARIEVESFELLHKERALL